MIFAVKGVIAMAMALFVSMSLGLDRPYWALVSAIFLQIRPESGLVIEKVVCQVAGSVVGGLVGILILAFLTPYPYLALAGLALWVGLNSAAATMVLSRNFTYAFAMAAMTAGLVVVMVMVDTTTANSEAVFVIAQARISEIAVGAVCAMLVSQLLWPVQVKDSLRRHARNVINMTVSYLTLELDPKSTHEQRHQQADKILETLMTLTEDSSAVVYEGPEGPGRARAANVLCNKVMSLLAVIQILGRFHRNHGDLVSPAFATLQQQMQAHFKKIVAANNYGEAYLQTQALRRDLLEKRERFVDESAIIFRMTRTSLELVADLVVVLRAYNALENRDSTLLNAPKLTTHRDPLLGAINGLRTAVVFLIGAGVWVATASPAAVVMMIMPVVFSVTLARFSLVALTSFMRRLLVGVIVSIPFALVFGLALLSQGSGDYEILVLVLAGPYFLGLLALAKWPTLPYGLGFCIPFTIIVQPSNNMMFNVEVALSTALGLFVGIGLLYWVFKLVAPPDSQLMQRRLLKATARDLLDIDNHPHPENWFNGRMGERLLRLANYDQDIGHKDRYITDLGFTGLNLGHVSMRLRQLIKKHRGLRVDARLQQWQQALAETYLMSSRGESNTLFRDASARLLVAVRAGQEEPDNNTLIAEGLCERLALTFERTAMTVSAAKGKPAWSSLETGQAHTGTGA
ncbi:FUSC family protein [Marinobacter sp. X15-166B]|uniref:FUSC family protein n=1 Tax=Marinobacter sp. X15-166B TaxID=1897620 RepID=UPI001D179BB1|nr:FUSC family protein [Marinobacter sp. X15-166B]